MMPFPCGPPTQSQSDLMTINQQLIDASVVLTRITHQVADPIRNGLTGAKDCCDFIAAICDEIAAINIQAGRLCRDRTSKCVHRSVLSTLANADQLVNQLTSIQDGVDTDDQDTSPPIAQTPVSILPAAVAPAGTGTAPVVSPGQPTVPDSPVTPGPCPPPIVNVQVSPQLQLPPGVMPQSPTFPITPAIDCNLYNPWAWISRDCAKDYLDSISNNFGPALVALMAANGTEEIEAALADLVSIPKG